MKLFLVLFVLLIAGCKEMTNDEVIAETKKCIEAGMKVEKIMSLTKTMSINCVVKKEDRAR